MARDLDLRRFFQGLVLLGGLAAWSLQTRSETLVVVGDLWCPINCEPNSDRPGIFIELAQEIFAESGIRVEYQTVNWARAIHAVRNGRANALVGAGYEDAPDLLFTTIAPGVSRMCFYARPGSSWHFRGIDSLDEVSIGVINGYSYDKTLDGYIRRHAKNGQRVQIASGDQALGLNVSKVLHGRIDVMLENSWVMANQLARSRAPIPELIEVGCREPDVPIYLAFSPVLERSREHLALFEDGLRRYRQNGRLKALMARYGVSE